MIKFKAWHINEKMFVDIVQFHFDADGETIIGVTYFALGHEHEHEQRRYIGIGGVLLFQALGLPDKNKKEIYDKDIIKTGYLEDKGYLVGVVEWQKRSARWGIRVGYRLIEFGKRGRWYEIIGNICESPRLLKEE